MVQELSISEVSKKLGISVPTLRYYDKIGLVIPHRNINQYRQYNLQDILHLKYISVMKYANFSLSDICTMMKLLESDPSPECKDKAVILLTKKYAEIQKIISNYSNLLQLLQKSIKISEKIDSIIEDQYKIDNFIVELFQNITRSSE